MDIFNFTNNIYCFSFYVPVCDTIKSSWYSSNICITNTNILDVYLLTRICSQYGVSKSVFVLIIIYLGILFKFCIKLPINQDDFLVSMLCSLINTFIYTQILFIS